MPTLTTIRRNLAAARIAAPATADAVEAAVLLALTDNDTAPELVLTLRAGHLNSHSGEVALPGGKWEPEDGSLQQTALRESWEEIGLEPAAVEVLSPLQSYSTRQGMRVTPYVGIIPSGSVLTANPEELDAVFRVPLTWFNPANRVRTDIYSRNGEVIWSPAFNFEGFEIWGFTARVVTVFLNDYAGVPLHYESAAPIKNWGVVD